MTTPAPLGSATLAIRLDQPGATINPNLYGQFAEHLGRCVYEGVWVGPDSPIPNTRGIRNDVIAALRELKVPVLRWPGGCFADEYHWRDGIGPREQRPSMINTHWGGVVENNHFGTHEFLDLCELIGAEPYISGNVGSGTVREMMEWVEYMTSDARSPMADLRRQNGREQPWRLRYFGVGNESWGCGGSMRPEYYADQFRRYNTFVKNYGANRIERIACGANAEDYHWTEVLMKNAGGNMNALSLHYYTIPTGDWKVKGSALDFDKAAWHETLRQTLRMEGVISAHAAIMDKHDPARRVGMVVDEWGAWYDVEPGTNPGFLYQQNSLRDALVAAVNFHIFHHHAERVTMTNIAQMVNVLQSVILTDKERMVLTPTYHVFEMYKVFQGATVVPLDLKSPPYTVGETSIPAVTASAARDHQGRVQVGLANLDPDREIEVSATLAGLEPKSVSGRLLTAPAINSHNTFAEPNAVQPIPFSGTVLHGGSFKVKLPAKSVVVLAVE